MKRLIFHAAVGVASILLRLRPYARRVFGAASLRLVKDQGSDCVFEGAGTLIDPDKLSLGDDVWIGRNFFIRATGGVRIGSFTHISRNVVIHTVNHNIDGAFLPYDRDDKIAPIDIGQYVWIGMNVNILPGITIGDGAVIGMGTTVSRDIKAGDIVTGSAARIVGHRDPDHTKRLSSHGRYLRNRHTHEEERKREG